MRRIAAAVVIGILLAAGALLLLSSSAPALAAPASAPLPAPCALPHAQNYLTVTCGDTETYGPCDALCMWTQGSCLWLWRGGGLTCVSLNIGIPEETWKNQTHLYAWPQTEGYEHITDTFYYYHLPNVVHLNTVVYSPPDSDGWSRGGFWVSAPVSGTVRAIAFRASQGPVGGPPYDVQNLTFKRMEGEFCGGSETCELWPNTSQDLGVRFVCVERAHTEYCDLIEAVRVGTAFYPPTTGVPKYAGFECGWSLEGYECDAYDFSFIVEFEEGEEPPESSYITPTADSLCVVTQTINIYTNFGTSAAEIDRVDVAPLGLYPFVNGLWAWPTPLSEVVLRYEFGPKRVFIEPGPGEPFTSSVSYEWPTQEKHIVAWRFFGTDFPVIPPGPGGLPLPGDPGKGPLEVYECISPKRPQDDCPNPRWYDLSGWIPWLWCNQRAWFAYFDNEWRYYVCIVQATIARAINLVIVALTNFYTNIAMQLYELAYLIFDYYKAWSDWVYVNWQGFVYWLREGRIWALRYYEQNSGEVGRFVAMAVDEGASWLGVMLDWLANDVVQGSINAAAHVASVIFGMTSLLASEFSRAINDIIDIIMFVVKAVKWTGNLATDLIEGFRNILDDDLEADLFTSFSPAFWSGLVLFEDIASSTPIGVLNTVSLGMIFFGLVWWTLGQMKGLMDDLLKFA